MSWILNAASSENKCESRCAHFMDQMETSDDLHYKLDRVCLSHLFMGENFAKLWFVFWVCEWVSMFT